MQSQQSQPVASPAHSQSPPDHFVVKRNKFSFEQTEDSDSDPREESKSPPKPVQPVKSTEKEEIKTEEEDLAAILRDFGPEKQVEGPVSQPSTGPLLRKEAKHFNSDWEISKKFKTATVQSRTHSTRTLKRTLLTPNAWNWPASVEYALEMEMVSGGSQPVFCFQASRSYLKLQSDYMSSVETNDPQSLFHFLQAHPFHLEALFQGCLFYLLQSNYEQTALLLERLLYVFQLSFHHQFSILSPDIRLILSDSLYNRLFCESLFMHVDILGRKGCSRTALEVSKLLLSLDPGQDPMGSLFLLEYFSLRCKKYEYFCRLVREFCGEVHGHGSLIWMPNYIYSFALVKVLTGAQPDRPAPVSTQTRADLAAIRDWKGLFSASADVVLALAISLYPDFACRLLQRLAKSVPANMPPQADLGIGNMTNTALIYTERCGDLWKGEGISAWLQAGFSLCAQEPQDLGLWKGWVDLPFSLDRYSGLDKGRFSETVHTAVPEELLAAGAVQRPARIRGNLSAHMHPLLLYLALLLPWNSVDFPAD